jgi:hydrogenase expression/formation protein HypC
MIPGRVEKIEGDEPTLRTALVDFSGIVKRVNLIYLPEAEAGNYVIVHAGFATEVIPEEDAREAIRTTANLYSAGEDAVKERGNRPSPQKGRTFRVEGAEEKER